MRTLKQLALSIAMVAILGMCAMTVRPQDNEVTTTVIDGDFDPIVKVVEQSVDGLGVAIGHIDQEQVYPDNIDSVTTYKLKTTDKILLQVVHLQDGTALHYTRYLYIKNLIYRDFYASFRDKWNQEEYNRHRLHVMEKELVSYDLTEIHLRTTWNYFNAWLAKHGEFGISYNTFISSIMNQANKDETIPPDLIIKWDNVERNLWINIGAVFGLLITGCIIGLITSWTSKKVGKTKHV